METFFEFHVSGHEPARFSATGDLTVPAGREIAVDLRTLLIEPGLECSDVQQRDYYGWEWAFTVDGFEANCTLQFIDCFLLIVDMRSGLRCALHREKGRNAYPRAVACVRSALTAIDGVVALREMTEQEYTQK